MYAGESSTYFDEVAVPAYMKANLVLDCLSKSEVRKVKIKKCETQGFGFEIIGGTDGAYVPGYDGIFISHVGREDLDKQIQEGDRLISVNGISLESIRHDDAYKLLNSLDGTCLFEIESNASQKIASNIDSIICNRTSTDKTLEQAHDSIFDKGLIFSPMPPQLARNIESKEENSSLTGITVALGAVTLTTLTLYIANRRK